MVVDITKLKTVAPLTVEDLEKMHTGSLLTRLKSLQQLHESFAFSDWREEEKAVAENSGLICFKNTDEWRAAFADLKSVLAGREHIKRGGKEARQRRETQKKTK